jgi:C1A family cysteine protease
MTPSNPEPEERKINEVRAAVRSAGATWEAGPTSMAAIPLDRFRRRLGAVPPRGGPTLEAIARDAEGRKSALMAERAAAGLPAAYDLRNVGGKNFITPIKDQDDCGSCVAFGVCAAIEGTVRVSLDDPDRAIDLSEAHLFYCHGRNQGRTCDNGWIPDEALETCQSLGVADEECYPYVAGDQNCTGRCSDWQQRVAKVTAYHIIGSTADMKHWIVEEGPLTACFVVFEDFRYYQTGVYRHVSGAQVGGHCVTIIGYDDAQQCWICKNSWGTGWGENGYFRIGYGECGIDTWQVCAVDGVELPKPEEEAWQRNRRISGLWSIDQERNAWVYATNLGWRRISPKNDNVFSTLLVQLATAKAAHRPVDFLEEEGVITQAYVL